MLHFLQSNDLGKARKDAVVREWHWNVGLRAETLAGDRSLAKLGALVRFSYPSYRQLISWANLFTVFEKKKETNWQPGATSDMQPFQKFLSSTFLSICVSFLALKEHSSNMTYYLSVTFHQRAQRWRSPAGFLKIRQNVLSLTQTYFSNFFSFFK